MDSLYRHSFASFPLALALILASYLTALGDGPPEIPGFKLEVQGHVLSFSSIDGKLPKDLVIPRMFNAIKGVAIQQGQKEIAGSVQPEIQTWKLSWPTTASDLSGGKVVLELDSAPQWEAKAVRPEADGSFRLRACQALTKGSKLRYEPQPHKNTVGYWVDASDYAWWSLHVDRPESSTWQLCKVAEQGRGEPSFLPILEGREQRSRGWKLLFGTYHRGNGAFSELSVATRR